MSSILDIERGITTEWLKENGWMKTPSFTRDRNPWWIKTFNGLSSNGGTRDIKFAYNDEDMQICLMNRVPYPDMIVDNTMDIEVFIKIQLENYIPIQYLGSTYLMEKSH